jgi:tRNA-modifying protein YgfZ
MFDKQASSFTTPFPLSSHSILEISGADALRFTQLQFMNDLNHLHDGQWQWNGWLTAKGRVIALFAILRIDANTLWLVLPDMPADAFATQLQRYVFRSKVILRVLPHATFGQMTAPQHASHAQFATLPNGVIELDMSGAETPRTLCIHPETTTHPALHADADAALNAWCVTDLRHGFPRLSIAQSEQWTPQQLSLERLHAYSVKKGCYPGQEIVARTHFLGQAKRGLAVFTSQHPFPLDSDAVAATLPELTTSDGQRAGQTIASCHTTLLAVIALDASVESAQAGDTQLQRQQLLDGLAR